MPRVYKPPTFKPSENKAIKPIQETKNQKPQDKDENRKKDGKGQ